MSYLILKKTKKNSSNYNKQTNQNKTNMKNINLIQQTNILKWNWDLNKNNFFWSSVTNLRVVRCWSQVGLGCSVRNYYNNNHYHDNGYNGYNGNKEEKENDYSIIYNDKVDKEEEDLNRNKYKVVWTKDYKNLNKMLSIKGLESDSNKLIDNNNIKYLVLSLTDTKYNLSVTKDSKDKKDEFFKTQTRYSKGQGDKDIFYSVSLILQSSEIKDEKDEKDKNKKWLYKIILSKLQENSSLIKEGGQLDLYYVASSELEDNIKEGYRVEGKGEEGKGIFNDYVEYYTHSSEKKLKLIPSISEVINLNKVINNELKVNIYVFTCETFFRYYLSSKNVFSPYTKLDRNNNKLWAFPILIIEEMTLSTVTFLFKERGLNLHGMSNTRRHKLSPLHKNLSNFLYITDLDDTIKKTHLIFIDNLYTNNKIDSDLHKNIYKIHKENFETYKTLQDDKRKIEKEIEKFRISDTNKENKMNEIITNINKIGIYNITNHQRDQISEGIAKRKKEFKENLLKEKRLEYLNNKIVNLKDQSMSPKVIIFMLRNQIFKLEIEKWEFETRIKKDSHNKKDYLTEYYKLKDQIEELISEKSNLENNENIIIETLNSNVKTLESEISDLEKLVEEQRTEIAKNREKQSEFIAQNVGMGQKKQKKKLKEMRLENETLNQQINIEEQQIKTKKLETKDILSELYKKQKQTHKSQEIAETVEKIGEIKKEIKTKLQNLDASNLISTANEIVLDKLNEKIDLIQNMFITQNLINTINNRKKRKKKKKQK